MDAIKDNYVTEYFDDYLVGSLGNTQTILGYDQYENDYFHLTDFVADLAQKESGKRLMRLTKEQIIAIGGQCFGILISYLDLQHEYDCLTAVFGLIKNERENLLGKVSNVMITYEQWASANRIARKEGKLKEGWIMPYHCCLIRYGQFKEQ